MLVALPSTIFFAIPNDIILGNQHSLPSSGKLLSFMAIGFVCYFSLLTIFLLKKSPLFQNSFRFIFGVGLLLICFNLSQDMSTHLSDTIRFLIDIAIMFLVFWMIKAPSWQNFITIFSYFGFALCISHLPALYLNKSFYKSSLLDLLYTSEAPNPATTLAETKQRGNVYHIILDGFQSDIYSNLAESDPTLVKKDFIVFENYKSAYWRTHFSIPSIFLGEYYDGSEKISYWTYKKFRNNGLLKTLSENHVDIEQYVYYPYYCSALATICDSQVKLASKLGGTQTLADILFLRLLPSSFHNRIKNTSSFNVLLGKEKTLGFSITHFLGFEPVVPLQIHPVHSLQAFERFLSKEKTKADNNRYVFMHLILPHGPYVLDPNCEIDMRDRDELEGYKWQARCGLKLIDRLIDELKRLKRYDNSSIIVHSDHGYQFTPGNNGKVIPESLAIKAGIVSATNRGDGDTRSWTSRAVAMGANSLLMIKFQNTNFPNLISKSNVGPLHFAPTIVEEFKITTDDFNNLSFQKILNGQEPSRPVHYANNELSPTHFSRYQFQDEKWLYVDDVEFIGSLVD